MNEIVEKITQLVSGLFAGVSRHSMSSLDASIAAAASAHIAARRALAVAVAEEDRETTRRNAMDARATDLEARAIAAIQSGRDDLAMAASEAIAELRTEIDASDRASVRFAAEVALARREVDAQRRRLADLDRGRRLVRVTGALNRTVPGSKIGHDALTEAEEKLATLNAENADARAIRGELAPRGERLIEAMSDEGFGTPIRVRASDIMDRLRLQANSKAMHAMILAAPHNQT